MSLSLNHPTFNEKDEKRGAESPVTARSSFDKGQVIDTTNEEDEEVVVDWRTWLAAASGASCVFSGYYTGLLLGNTSAFVTATFDAPHSATWIANEYTIITAAIGGLTGSCADHIGRKNVLIGGIAIACIGSIIIAAAQNMASVLVGAAFQAGLFINQGNFFSIPAEVLPRRFRGLGQTMTVSAGGAGVLVGFMFSGTTIRDNTGGLGWRSTYIMGACIHALAIICLLLFYRPLQKANESRASHMKALRTEVDWVGAVLLAAGLGLFMTGLTLGSTTAEWSSGSVLGTLCAGAGGLVLTALHQIFVNKHGILDHDLWTRNFCVAILGCFVEGFVYYAILLFFQLETETLWEKRPFWINVRMLAFFVTSGVVAPVVGLYTRKTRDCKNPLLVGWALVLVGFIILTTAKEASNYTSIGGLFIAGVGFSTPLALLFAVAQLATAPHLLGLTTGQLIAARCAGQTVSAAILAAVYDAKIQSILPAEVSAAVSQAGLSAGNVPAFIGALTEGNSSAMQSVPGATAAVISAGMDAATDAYVKAFHYGWYTALPFAILAFLIVFLLNGETIKKQMTWLVERPVVHTVHRRDSAHSVESRRASLA